MEKNLKEKTSLETSRGRPQSSKEQCSPQVVLHFYSSKKKREKVEEDPERVEAPVSQFLSPEKNKKAAGRKKVEDGGAWVETNSSSGHTCSSSSLLLVSV